ncbi:MAG: hypothetical protein PHU25_11250 [Deltaproteobacteria bacterium]|nr:hypothetical protein [Deltaproteobacteria bacterium]
MKCTTVKMTAAAGLVWLVLMGCAADEARPGGSVDTRVATVPAAKHLDPSWMIDAQIPGTRPQGMTIDDGECCSSPGQADECWDADRQMDGIVSCTPENAWEVCDSRLCVEGKCAASYCNGFLTCSCWGGCAWWDPDTSNSPGKLCAGMGLSCCEGDYPTDSSAVGYCSDDPTCGKGCVVDEQCLDDGNVCTNEYCDVDSGRCFHTHNTLPCDDENACTLMDTCSDGTCISSVPLNCDDANPCTDDSCDPATGCVHVNNTDPCDDGSACTMGDVCLNGACVGGPPRDCNDGNPCTDDSCNPITGCVDTPNTAACNDGNLCTADDTCSGGVCVGGPPVDCNDSNPCTNDSCIPNLGCWHNNNADVCDDGDVCTTSDACSGGACVGGPPLDCNDDNVCTDDTCNALLGCVRASNTARCDDGNACTNNDTCSNGVCVGAAITCNDGNPCTDDTCDPATGCVFSNNTRACSDGNACTTNDRCQSGTCMGGPALVCNDGNLCTTDSCDTSVGCVYVNNTVVCSDGNECTTSDHCSGGVCTGGPAPNCNDGNVCTTDSCDPATPGGCVHANNTLACDDANTCTTGEHCSAGSCTGGSALPCGDGNPCTDDSCNPATGCTHSNNTAACDDGTPCTVGDVCAGAWCVPGAPKDCDDGNLCTVDSCTPGTGACANTWIPGCCRDATDCGDACSVDPTDPDADCQFTMCDLNRCVCVPDPGNVCSPDPLEFPPNCYEGACNASGSCEPSDIGKSDNDICRQAFVSGDPAQLDTAGAAYLGMFTNSSGPQAILVASGTNLCANDNYEATGINCKEAGGADDIGHAGKDVVYAFRYQTSAADQYRLYSYLVKVEADFNVGIYIRTDIENADQCPEGMNEGLSGKYTVASARCYYPYTAAAVVMEDECDDSGNTLADQQCCYPDPKAGETWCEGNNCWGSDCGYYWCRRFYPEGCCDYDGDECEPGLDTTWPLCTGTWEYPRDPYNCNLEKEGHPYSQVASAVIYPDGAVDGSYKTVFIFVDGVTAADPANEGNFYVTVQRQEWSASPCDRVNDDARVFDLTSAGGSGATWIGTLSSVVNSMHAGSGDCGGYSCDNNDWGGATACHEAGTANEFWPNTEHFKIERSPGTGNRKYCIMTDEAGLTRADLVLSIDQKTGGGNGICSASYSGVGCAHNTTKSGSLTLLPTTAGDIKAEFTANEGVLYLVQLSEYAQRTQPCGTVSGDKCDYKLTVTEYGCPPTCASPPEMPRGTINIDDVSYGFVTNSGTLTSGDGNTYDSPGVNDYADENWTLQNNTTVAVSATVRICPTTSWNVIAGLWSCANANLTVKNSFGNSTSCETFTYTVLPGQPYYIVADGRNNGSYGSYNLQVEWGTAPTACKAPDLWTIPYNGPILGPLTGNGSGFVPSNVVSGSSCDSQSWSGFGAGFDELWRIDMLANDNVFFTECPGDGGSANFDTTFALFDCTGKLVESNDDGCWGWSSNSKMHENMKATRAPYYFLIDGVYASGNYWGEPHCGDYTAVLQ